MHQRTESERIEALERTLLRLCRLNISLLDRVLALEDRAREEDIGVATLEIELRRAYGEHLDA